MKAFDLAKLISNKAKRYRKKALTKARPLSQKDYEQLLGTLITKEGPVKFIVGDFLAEDETGNQWKISAVSMRNNKRLIKKLKEEEEWGLYLTISTIQAAPISSMLNVTLADGSVLRGKVHDYLAYNGYTYWIIDKYLFERDYEMV